MTSTTCGWCKVHSHMTMYGLPRVTDETELPLHREYLVEAAFVCDSCDHMSICSWHLRDYPYDLMGMVEFRAGPDVEGEDVTWFPLEGHQQEFRDVPDKIAEAAAEAWTCYMAGAHRGAVLLARAAVEAAAKHRGITTGNLAKKIDLMAEQGMIGPDIAYQAHEIRFAGNSTAHADLDTAVTKELAFEVLFLVGQVLNSAIQAPAVMQRLKDQRLKKPETLPDEPPF